ncbi:histone deacetylase family protein [Methylomicrobium sp. Wu6]|uniref:histone deacetylase family protein n=1 Tax=Methylomicrobium sp. Wu6 TaxID=3107928 RepID=UPI002DD67477|nr:histone deacetylase family protein [Methylomicrobium sp. Wu6]MEC4749934.1 histone deacetylase family protein [Methylomicrobium sp. Wu6]
MTTLYYYHEDFLKHQPHFSHPESPNRLLSIEKALQAPEFAKLVRKSPPLGQAQRDQAGLIHSQAHIDRTLRMIPEGSHQYIDADTYLSHGSANAALRAVGAVCDAVDQVMAGKANNAFCAVRPPGHHAEPNRAMGFCLFNNVAIAAEYARQQHHIRRVAIVDFDVHHGNGTQAAFAQQAEVLYISSHEMPHYPGTGLPSETGVGNIVNIPLIAGTEGTEFRHKISTIALPALRKFKPELLLISAGFDAHRDDPLADIELVEDDYRWITEELTGIAAEFCERRIVSALEGGYNLEALARSVAAHVGALLRA